MPPADAIFGISPRCQVIFHARCRRHLRALYCTKGQEQLLQQPVHLC